MLYLNISKLKNVKNLLKGLKFLTLLLLSEETQIMLDGKKILIKEKTSNHQFIN